MRPDIKKRREKYESPTLAKRIFEGKELLTCRKSGMTFDQYILLRRYETKLLKELFRRKPDRHIERLMRPSVPSPHLQQMIFKARLKKLESLEALQPKEAPQQANFISAFFNKMRDAFGQKTL